MEYMAVIGCNAKKIAADMLIYLLIPASFSLTAIHTVIYACVRHTAIICKRVNIPRLAVILPIHPVSLMTAPISAVKKTG